MRAPLVQTEIPQREGEDAPYEMANLFPRDPGLPMTIWVGPRGRARHDVRIKVCTTLGDRLDPTKTAVVAVRPEPRLLHGELPAEHLALVAKWIELNRAALVGYWEGRLSTVEFVLQLQKV